jgi:hypothetical protein
MGKQYFRLGFVNVQISLKSNYFRKKLRVDWSRLMQNQRSVLINLFMLIIRYTEGTGLFLASSTITNFRKGPFASKDSNEAKEGSVEENLSKFEIDPIPD